MFDLTGIILTALAVLITLTLHEYAHGYAAYKMGDPTARNLGRLTLNPIKHIDPIGALCMLFFHIGWAKPVPINPRNFKNPRKGFAITALAGPLLNLILAFITAGLYLFTYALIKDINFQSQFLYNLVSNTFSFIGILHSVNIGLGIFNLIPIPPLDGSRLLTVILPPKSYFAVMKYERVIYWILIGWLIIGDGISSFLLSMTFVATNPVLSVIAKALSLSELISIVTGALSDAMMNFWQLIPFLKV